MYSQFDMVELLTTRGITYLSDRPGSIPSPHGPWHVAGTVDGDLLLVKGTALARVPALDVRKVAGYDITKIYDDLKRVKNGEISGNGPTIDGHEGDRGEV